MKIFIRNFLVNCIREGLWQEPPVDRVVIELSIGFTLRGCSTKILTRIINYNNNITLVMLQSKIIQVFCCFSNDNYFFPRYRFKLVQFQINYFGKRVQADDQKFFKNYSVLGKWKKETIFFITIPPKSLPPLFTTLSSGHWASINIKAMYIFV